MTIGVGFLCNDGVLLCADTQVTWSGGHKYYESKIYVRMRPQWTVAFTYAGNPNLAKSFDGKLEATMGLITQPHTVYKIQNGIEALLSTWDVLDTDQDGLHMMCAVVVPNDDMILLKTDRKIVSRVKDYEYVGVGDSFLLRHISFMIGSKPEYRRISEAFPLAVYLVMQAKRYVDGCGGDTEALVINPDGVLQYRSGGTFNVEQHLLHIEHSTTKVVRSVFDNTIGEAAFDQEVNELRRRVKEVRGTLNR